MEGPIKNIQVPIHIIANTTDTTWSHLVLSRSQRWITLRKRKKNPQKNNLQFGAFVIHLSSKASLFGAPQTLRPVTRESLRQRALSTRHSCLCLSSSSSHKPARLDSSRFLFRLRSAFIGKVNAGNIIPKELSGSCKDIIASCYLLPCLTRKSRLDFTCQFINLIPPAVQLLDSPLTDSDSIPSYAISLGQVNGGMQSFVASAKPWAHSPVNPVKTNAKNRKANSLELRIWNK